MKRNEQTWFKNIMSSAFDENALKIQGKIKKQKSDSNGYFYEFVPLGFFPSDYGPISMVIFFDSFARHDQKTLYAGFWLSPPAYKILKKSLSKSQIVLNDASIEKNPYWVTRNPIRFEKIYFEEYKKTGKAHWYGMYFDLAPGSKNSARQETKIHKFFVQQASKILNILIEKDTAKLKKIKEGEDIDVEGGMVRSRKSRLYRTVVIDRAQGRCQACGWHAKIGDSYILDVHHKIPIKKGSQSIVLENLIALCPTCHRLAHSSTKLLNIHQIKALLKKTGRSRDAP